MPFNDIDFNDYVGIPFDPGGTDFNGTDCYHLGWMIYRDAGVDIPCYSGLYKDTEDPVLPSIIQEQCGKLWSRIDTPDPFDFITLRVAGLPWHVGIYIGQGKMLHVQIGETSKIVRLNHSQWKHRILGYWRHNL